MSKIQKGKNNFQGHKHTIKLRRKMKLNHKGFLGHYHSRVSIKKMSGENKYNWKGDKVSYIALHKWLRQHKSKPKFCEFCNKRKKLTIANISGKYIRNLKDYKWLCYSCHLKYDYANGRNKK